MEKLIKRRPGAKLVFISAAIVSLKTFTIKMLARSRAEKPKYKITATYPGFEVREYEPRIVAEVTVDGNPSAASDEGFRILASYIFGNNEAEGELGMRTPSRRRGIEIGMTVPVEFSSAEGRQGRWVLAFNMPSRYTLEGLPKPRDPRVTIRKIAARRYAAMRFSGVPQEDTISTRSDVFVQMIEAAGLTRSDAAPTYARYDPPWTPGFLRRNEILVELAG